MRVVWCVVLCVGRVFRVVSSSGDASCSFYRSFPAIVLSSASALFRSVFPLVVRGLQGLLVLYNQFVSGIQVADDYLWTFKG